MQKSDPILVAGAGGMVGAAIVRKLEAGGFTNLLTPRRQQLDLRDTLAVREYLADLRPRAIYVAAATVGGIHANDAYAASFIYDNLMIEANLVNGAHDIAVEKLLFLGSTCIYPKLCPQPIKEEYLLTGPLETSNEWYAVAKIAGVKLCQAYRKQYGDHFICAMPTNLYGPNDSFDLENSHVLPALMRKFHEAKETGAPSVTVWGSGAPMREFLHVDDCAAACTFLMQHYDDAEIVNIGVGHDISILDLAHLIRDIVGFEGELRFDASKPDGTPRKLVDVTKITELGWQASIELREGIAATYAWYREALRDGTVRQ